VGPGGEPNARALSHDPARGDATSSTDAALDALSAEAPSSRSSGNSGRACTCRQSDAERVAVRAPRHYGTRAIANLLAASNTSETAVPSQALRSRSFGGVNSCETLSWVIGKFQSTPLGGPPPS
jgi:hypothetical protein